MRFSQTLQNYAVPAIFMAVGIPLCFLSGTTIPSLLNELLHRLAQNGILVLALLPPLQAGLGFNFGTGVGAWAAQAGFMIAAAYGLSGPTGVACALVLGLVFAAGLGGGIGWLLDRMRGLEMLMTLLLIPLSMFPLFMITRGLGAVLPPPVPSTTSRHLDATYVDLQPFRHALDVQVTLGPLTIPIGSIALLALAACAVFAFQRFTGRETGSGIENPPSPRRRIAAFTLSLMLTCISHSIILQDMPGTFAHHVHRHTVFPSIPALVAGGALLNKAKLHHAFLGMVVLNILYIPLPDMALDMTEIVKTMVSTGLILFALTRGPLLASPESADSLRV